jgi:hypothetical protein
MKPMYARKGRILIFEPSTSKRELILIGTKRYENFPEEGTELSKEHPNVYIYHALMYFLDSYLQDRYTLKYREAIKSARKTSYKRRGIGRILNGNY